MSLPDALAARRFPTGLAARSGAAALVILVTMLVRPAPVTAQDQPASTPGGENQPGQAAPPADAANLLDLNLEQLSKTDVVVPALETVVTTVSRQQSTVGRSPAAVFVIDQEMIRRSGARHVPDLLRMAPGIQVAQVDGSRWAITARGFNGLFANKLLVQIDGRAVYTQLFGGVYWDVQDLILADIERIEVIRGPGATVWGANAVNGVINIITKRAVDTQGALIVSGGGTEERAFNSVRYGGKFSDDVHWRAYGKQFERDEGFSPLGAYDDSRQARTGFRVDWTASEQDLITFQGDAYNGYSGALRPIVHPTFPFLTLNPDENHVAGGNALFRWDRTLDADTGWVLQTYYDRIERHAFVFAEDRDTFDVDFQYRLRPACDHSVIWGCGYRHSRDDVQNFFGLEFNPASRSTDLYSCFIQDEITLEPDRWYLTTGSKFEHNAFSGFEVQPTIRLLHLPHERASAWAAVSRAVRTPTRADQDVVIRGLASPVGPTFSEYRGSRAVEAESVIAYEVGYRAQPTAGFSWDLAVFFNQYDDLVGGRLGGPVLASYGFTYPVVAANNMSGESYGAELAANWQISPCWKLMGSYTFLELELHGEHDRLAIEGASPHHQLYVQSSWNLGCQLEFDLIGRYADSLPSRDSPSYFVTDMRLAWRPCQHWEMAVVGRNLLDHSHPEFVDVAGTVRGTEVERGVYGILTWRR